ncbi:MAG: endonuclease/exonuclease/phosphatase family protein [Clostridia bacterium]|nr:endonuclease/exonuclease/phosphatase family protein [Clostridia bacterium]
MNIKFLQYNIAACRNYDTPNIEVNAEQVAEAIKSFDPDIVTLNEVDCKSDRSGNVDQLQFFTDKLGFYSYYAPSIEIPGGKYGIALLSRYKIVSAETIKIPDTISETNKELFEPRVLLSAVLDVNGASLRVMTSHFGLSPEEQEQAVSVTLNELSDKKMPTIFSGDLNMYPDNPFISKITSVMKDTANICSFVPQTYPSYQIPSFPAHDLFPRKIDYVFVSEEIETLAVNSPAIKLSDHRPYFCVLSL